jgi:hypothetical protein
MKSRDLTGKRFRKLKVIGFAGLNNHKKKLWKCICNCGEIITTIGNSLVSNRIKQCSKCKSQEIRKRKTCRLNGKRFGKLKVIRMDGYDHIGNAIWLCQCDCGNITRSISGNLNAGIHRSCGCLQKDTIAETLIEKYVDKKFGRLIAISRAAIDDGRSYWNCLCDCGKHVIVCGHSLMNGNTQSCGCYKSDRIREEHAAKLEGQRFGRLTVISCYGSNKNNQMEWKCKCDCGGEALTTSGMLLGGHTQSCGCYRSDRSSETCSLKLEGQKFNMLTVIERVGSKDQNSLWKCKCDCGNETLVRGVCLVRGTTKSCGCRITAVLQMRNQEDRDKHRMFIQMYWEDKRRESL